MKMKTPYQLRFQGATEVCSHFSDWSSVKYSETAGFFIETTVWQVNNGSGWENLEDATTEFKGERIYEDDELGRIPNHRRFQTYRPISRAQAIRIFLDAWDDHGGMMTAIDEALDAAGIEPLQISES
jgi:hypothetical protein